MIEKIMALLVAFIAVFFVAPVTKTFADYADTVIADGPFAYYRLEQSNLADTVVDQMGNHHGSFEGNVTPGITGATSYTGSATEFDGGYVKLDKMGNFGSSCGLQFSAEYWVKVYETPGYVLGVNCPPEFNTQFRIGCHYSEQREENYWLFYFRGDVTQGRYSIYYYGQEVFDQQWHHMVWTYEADLPIMTDRWHLFIDGVEKEPIVTAASGRPNTSDFNIELFLGAHNHRGQVRSPLSGCLDEIALYTHTLNIEEVQSHYEAAMGQIIKTCEIDIHPDTLNKKSKGKYVTCYIELPEDFSAYDIDITTAMLTINGAAIPAESSPTEIGDYNNNDILDCMVKFDRQSVQDACTAGAVECTLSCETYDGTIFEGADTVLVIDKDQNKF